MKMLVNYLTTLLLLNHAGLSLQLADECLAKNHVRLTRAARVVNNTVVAAKDDKPLEDGWYRFHGDTLQLAERKDIPNSIKQDKKAFAPCGANLINHQNILQSGKLFYLLDPHPSQKEGVVWATLGRGIYGIKTFPGPSLPGDRFLFCLDKTCDWRFKEEPIKITVRVRNCGGFYVYFFQKLLPLFEFSRSPSSKPTSVYCATSKNFTQSQDTNPTCLNYKNITDPTRDWSSSVPTTNFLRQNCNLDTNLRGWVRFISSNGEPMIPNHCPSHVTNIEDYQSSVPCGALYRGWIDGNYPQVHEGRVWRTLCFSHIQRCTCLASTRIAITNCGSFFVYSTFQYPMCNARVCTIERSQRNITARPKPPTVISSTVQLNISNVSTFMQPNVSSATLIVSTTSTSSSRSVTVSTSVHNRATAGNRTTARPFVDTTQTTTPIKTTPVMTTKPQQEEDMCEKYTTVFDSSRLFTSVGSRDTKCDLFYRPAVRFMSDDLRTNLMLKEGCDAYLPGYHCSAAGVTWLIGSHPNSTGEVAYSRVCLHRNPINYPLGGAFKECQCIESSLAVIKNCGDFFVYRLDPIQMCNGRYCLQIYNRTNITNSTISPQTTKKYSVAASAKYTFIGEVTLNDPMFNGESLTKKKLEDSLTRNSIQEAVKKYLENSLKHIKDMEIEISSLRLGSLIVEYKISSREPIDKNNVTASVTQKDIVNVEVQGRRLDGKINKTSASIKDFNECEDNNPCDAHAQCVNQPGTFYCSCMAGYQGDGITCTPEPIIDNEWSNTSIIVVVIMFSVCIVLILALAGCLCAYKGKSYKTGNFSHSVNKSGFDTYTSTGIPKEVDDAMPGAQINMYVSADQNLPKGNNTFQNDTNGV